MAFARLRLADTLGSERPKLKPERVMERLEQMGTL